MMRRYLPWLFLTAAVFALVATLTAKHVSVLWLGYRITHLLIAISYVFSHHFR